MTSERLRTYTLVFFSSAALFSLQIILPTVLSLFTGKLVAGPMLLPLILCGFFLGSFIFLKAYKPIYTSLAVIGFPISLVFAFSLLFMKVNFFFSIAAFTIPLSMLGYIIAYGIASQKAIYAYIVDLAGGVFGTLLTLGCLPYFGGEYVILGVIFLFLFLGSALCITFKKLHLLLLVSLSLSLLMLGSKKINFAKYLADERHLGLPHLSNFANRDSVDFVLTNWTDNHRVDVLKGPVRFWDPDFFSENPLKTDEDYGLFFNGHYFGRTHQNKDTPQNIKIYHHLRNHPKVAIVGTAGGTDIFTSLKQGAVSVTAIEISTATVKAMLGPLHEVSGQVYSKAELFNEDGRTFFERTDQKFDVIDIATTSSMATRLASLVDTSFLHTKEAIRLYTDKLTPTGLIYQHIWHNSNLPNFSPIPLFMTYVSALKDLKLSPKKHLRVLQESTGPWHTGFSKFIFILSRSGFTREDDQTLSAYKDSKSKNNISLRQSFPQIENSFPFSKEFTEVAKNFNGKSETFLGFHLITDDYPFNRYIEHFSKTLKRIIFAILCFSISILVFAYYKNHQSFKCTVSSPLDFIGLVAAATIGFSSATIEVFFIYKFSIPLGSQGIALNVVLLSMLAGGILTSFFFKNRRPFFFLPLFAFGLLLFYLISTNSNLIQLLTPLNYSVKVLVVLLSSTLFSLFCSGFFAHLLVKADQEGIDRPIVIFLVNGLAMVISAPIALWITFQHGFKTLAVTTSFSLSLTFLIILVFHFLLIPKRPLTKVQDFSQGTKKK